MKNDFKRDQQLHNEYKAKLKQESREIYGIEKCWASHKPYKGLIASHIKSYKLCVLDNDTYSEFNVNNGLLLSKTIDDYFDKLLITFGENGEIICSDKVQDEIKEEFTDYKLDEKIYNAERKNYMRIHRCLFYYKHYYNQSEIPANLRLDNIQVPFFDCGIKHYNGTFIVYRDDFWRICPTSKLKQEFIGRTSYKFKYYLSNADLSNILLGMDEYAVEGKFSTLLNTPNSTIDIENPTQIIKEAQFKISTTNCDIVPKKPEKFLDFLSAIFDKNSEIPIFRTILNFALAGNGYSKGVIFYGDIQNIDLLFSIIKNVFGSYLYNYHDTKILYKKVSENSIPNCSVVLFSNHNLPIEQHNWNRIVENSYFPKNILNVNKYIPFVTMDSNKPINLQNAIKIKISSMTKRLDIGRIINEECGAILHWIISDEGLSAQEFEESVKESKLITSECTIDSWLHSNCDFGDNIKNEEKAGDLYANYIQFTQKSDLSPVSERYFYLQLGKNLQKKRYSFGIVYIGIKIKNQQEK